MSIKNKETNCLERLSALNGSIDGIAEFLFSEKLLSMDDLKSFKQSPFQAKEMQSILDSLRTNERIQLLEYEWTILPVERIKITVITDRNSQEFCWNI